jgi:transcriptional regulator with XRE-family HTH domain
MDDSRHKQLVGDRLRQAREALGHTGRGGQAQFARLLGISRDKLNSYERGRAYPSALIIQQLWREYRISADFLFSGEIASLPHGLVGRLPSAAEEN